MKIKTAMTFKEAVEQTPDVVNGYQIGLNALGQYKNKLQVSKPRELEGSIDIDTCTTRLYPHANRWDYALSYKNKVYYVEVHSATTSEVSIVLKKLQWLKDWLNNHAPEIHRLPKAQPAFYWIQSGRFDILSTSRQYREIVQAGLKPISSLRL